jgi:F-type H+-transporting ATPase subunit alpha
VAVELQVAILYAVINGYLNDIPVDRVHAFEKELYAHLRLKHGDLLERIAKTGELSKEDEASLGEILTAFVADFLE